MRKYGQIFALASLFAVIGETVALPADLLPIVDAHLHYSQPAWGTFSPAEVIALMDQAGVARAVASSTPDDGTLMLVKHAPDRIVPFLRPYRGGVNSSNWTQDPALAGYLEMRLNRGGYRGIGEFHLWSAAEANSPNVKHVVALAVERGLYLEVHSGAEPVRALFAIDPKAKVLWAHAGMNESPATVGEMLERYPTLWTEVSFRADDIAPGEKLDPAWRALFLRFPDRFLVGSDTYTTERLAGYAELMREHRAWLAQLPADVAAAIAHGNAERLLGSAK